MSTSPKQSGSGSGGTSKGIDYLIVIILLFTAFSLVTYFMGILFTNELNGSIQAYKKYYNSVSAIMLDRSINNLTGYSYYYTGVKNYTLVNATIYRVASIVSHLLWASIYYVLMLGSTITALLFACEYYSFIDNIVSFQKVTKAGNYTKMIVLLLLRYILMLLPYLAISIILVFLLIMALSVMSTFASIISSIVLTTIFLELFQNLSPEYYFWLISAQLVGIDITLLVVSHFIEVKAETNRHSVSSTGNKVNLVLIIANLLNLLFMKFISVLIKVFVVLSIAFILSFTLLAFFNSVFLIGFLEYGSSAIAYGVFFVILMFTFQVIVQAIRKICSPNKPSKNIVERILFVVLDTP